jgi:hypothetical protein
VKIAEMTIFVLKSISASVNFNAWRSATFATKVDSEGIGSLMMRMFRLLVAWMLVPLFLIGPVYGWHHKGHKVVALIAFRQLKPATRDAVVAALKEHVAFKSGDWPGRLAPGADADASLFTLAAIFPDEVRSVTSPFHDLNDPPAHFINLPFIPVQSDRRDPRIREKDPSLTQNLSKAFRAHVQEIKSVSVSKEAQATSLSWLFHLEGDIQQPLHSVAMYTQVFKTGDRGGNGIKFSSALESRTRQKDLHAYWDGLPGEKPDFAGVDLTAKDLMTRFPQATFSNLDATIDECATESLALARKFAYQGLIDAPTLITDLPAGYEADAQKTADRQVALAGYRLAQLLEDLYGR